ncbi:hypothetical protein SAMN05444166_0449 [Singulisphaera sp. GP187]|uniref:hypothetical protein n=1 Tax=Singulisphaera sp. GP187 TaxID=1882752 RepID=UPI000928363E|nr:hypothetical protein [Singulisphaera sp. GP187]SIN72468.1 hypothetical protein SAMN05444166_0449 [Singulisphaera sp. GP187]
MAKLTQAEAAKKLQDAGITWSSSGNCSDRNNKRCTSFEEINSETVEGIISFKKLSGCDVRITGGTETGHSTSTKSHWNGFKVDINPSVCVSDFIETHFEAVGVRGDGAKMFKDGAGNIYARESNHWDITFISGSVSGEDHGTSFSTDMCGTSLRKH